MSHNFKNNKHCYNYCNIASKWHINKCWKIQALSGMVYILSHFLKTAQNLCTVTMQFEKLRTLTLFFRSTLNLAPSQRTVKKKFLFKVKKWLQLKFLRPSNMIDDCFNQIKFFFNFVNIYFFKRWDNFVYIS